MSARLVAILAAILAGCSHAGPAPIDVPPPASAAKLASPSAIAPAVAPTVMTPRISMADVVKQVVPGAKRALVFEGGDAFLRELAAGGIATEVFVPNQHRCVADLPATSGIDVIVADGAVVSRCPERHDDRTIAISRVRRKLSSIETRGILVDERCAEEGGTSAVCDTFELGTENATRWFRRGDLPLTVVHRNLSAPGASRVARGILVDGGLDLGGSDLGGTTFLRVDGSPAWTSSSATAPREELEGWWRRDAIAALPRQIRGIAEVHGAVRLDGSLGLGLVRWPAWTRPPDAPPEFALLRTPGTLLTMSGAGADFFVDAPALVRLNAKTNRSLADAAKAIATGDLARTKAPLDEALAAMRAAFGADHDFGRAAFLAGLTAGLSAAATKTGTDRAFALARTFNATVKLRAAPFDNAFIDAFYTRTCDELAPIAAGPEAAARAAADLAWPMYEEHTVIRPLFQTLVKRFGPPPEARR